MNVNALVKLIGINANTLRGWERRYKAVTPRRGEDGRRCYSAQDVERVRCLWELVKRGHTIGSIAQVSTNQLKKMLEQKSAFTLVPSETESPIFDKTNLDLIIDSLDKFDLERLNLNLQKARFHMSVPELIQDLIYPLMGRVGVLVNESRLSISQEHLLSSLLRDFLGGIHQSLSPYELSSRAGSKGIVICTREGDIHEFGILISAIMSNLHRYKNYYLGTSMPVDDLIDAVQRFKADVVLIGLMKLPQKTEIVSTYKFISELDKHLPKRIAFIVGGPDVDEVRKVKTMRKIYSIQQIADLEKILSQGI